MSNFKPYRITIETDIIIDGPVKDSILKDMMKNHIHNCNEITCMECPLYDIEIDCDTVNLKKIRIKKDKIK